MDGVDVVAALVSQGGVARRANLIAQGIPRKHIEEALFEQRIERHMRGVYAVPNPDQALLSALCAGADLACISAAKHLGLWIYREPSLIHVSVDHGRTLGDEFRVHRSVKPVTPVDVCVQSMRCLPELDALCIVESAVVQGTVALAQLRDRASGLRDTTDRKSVV